MPSEIDDAIAALGTLEAGSGELHESIAREIRAQAPLDQIVLAPWPSEGEYDGARTLAVWTDIGRRLIESGFGLVLAGSVENHAAAVTLRSAIGLPGVTLSIGRASLRQTAILLGRARGALSAPGTVARLAALTGTPLLVLNVSPAQSDPELAAQAAAAVSSLQSQLASVPVPCPAR